MQQETVPLDRAAERIIGSAFRMMNTLGAGFLEKVYERALSHELRKSGPQVCQQQAVTVGCDGVSVGEYTADLVGQNAAVVELKAVKALDSVDTVQRINHLKATGMPACRLINLGKPRLEIGRFAN
ncbi:MAG TPA: GxxExxY protein [Acetobacteraceae bacterium]|nr:GxxExxY protein [Acetobacteraceae bacterium]